MENFLEINYEKNMQMLDDAYKYCEEKFLHEQLIDELYNDNDLKKQFCIIEIEKINSQEEADILVYNLTGHSGPIRETASFKILDLIQKEDFRDFFQSKKILDIFVKAITDINPSVSRNTIEILKYIFDVEYIYNSIILEINRTLGKIENIKQTRSYTTNKNNFNLYWNLEALTVIADKIKADEELFEILIKTVYSNDYTIREKTAKAAKIFSQKNEKFLCITNILKDDMNIYVRKFL